MAYAELEGEQVRQLINAEQVFDAYRAARTTFRERFGGSLTWKTVGGHDYLYRAHRPGAWKSLGPRSPETELIHGRFVDGRKRARLRTALLAKRLDHMAALNQVHRLGRLPVTAARILRALDDAKLTKPIVATVGTNALYVYERMVGVQVAEAMLATADIDLLYDARASLKLVVPEVAATGVVGLLRKVDRSFEITGKGGFRAENRDGYVVDLITPAPRDPIRLSREHRIGTVGEDLNAVEIFGLSWLVNSPKITATVMDLRGYPVSMTVPDPRAFALHKSWLAGRPDREPAKQRRDRSQAKLIATLVTRYLPHLGFEDAALSALPADLRAQAPSLIRADTSGQDEGEIEPDW